VDWLKIGAQPTKYFFKTLAIKETSVKLHALINDFERVTNLDDIKWECVCTIVIFLVMAYGL